MRIVESQVGDIRRHVFAEVARLAFNGGNYKQEISDIPFRIIKGEEAKYRESIFLERAIVSERVRLAIGLPLRPIDEYAAISKGIEESVIDEKYYDPPLINIIKFACHSCPNNMYKVTDGCQGCLAHPCIDACPKDAISFGPHHRTVIDQDKCIKCGRCKKVCPYGAIMKFDRPCANACGVDAIGSDELGRAHIDQDKCVACGMCVVNCPFGAISDKGQIFQLIQAIKKGPVSVIVAPSFVGQFGPKATYGKLVSALREVGFNHVAEVSVGADLCAIQEAKDFIKEVPKELPFMATSCCPAWSVMAKKNFPEIANTISMALTPMVLTARYMKKRHPKDKIVFIGPCSAKKLEASRKTIRSYVDFVLTFEELAGIFEAKDIDVSSMEEAQVNDLATAAGKGFAVGGGVANAVVDVIKELDPDREVKVSSAMGLRECKEMLQEAIKGSYNGYLLEGMGCPGGCAAGTGTIQNSRKTSVLVNKAKQDATAKVATENQYANKLEVLEEMGKSKNTL
ncbi:MAG: 4Fe-4S dicluster domain-containing protein [Lachnospiraceae bacterium]|jgi:[FeFe] hydrogenase (group B1/B3)|nr:4Fe-4S dicluster domain-containing protein [Lachnospiraceae bacterium]